MIYDYYPTLSEDDLYSCVCDTLNDWLRQSAQSYQSEIRILSYTRAEVLRAARLALLDLDKMDQLHYLMELNPATVGNDAAGCEDCIAITLPVANVVWEIDALYEGCRACEHENVGFEKCLPAITPVSDDGNRHLGVRPMCRQCGSFKTCGCSAPFASLYTVKLDWGYSVSTPMLDTTAVGASNVPLDYGLKIVCPRTAAYVAQNLAVRAAMLQIQNSAFIAETLEEFSEMYLKQATLELNKVETSVLLSGAYASN